MPGFKCQQVNSKVCVIENPAPEQCAKCKVPEIYKGNRSVPAPQSIHTPKKLNGGEIHLYFEHNSPGYKHMSKEDQRKAVEQVLRIQEKLWWKNAKA